MEVLSVKKVSRLFANKRGVNNINFSLNKGEILALLGNNGAGKTTTIKCIMNLIKPSQGEIKVNNVTIDEDSYSYKNSISYIPDSPLYYDELTVYEHIKFISMAASIEKKSFEDRLNKLIKKFNVEKYRDSYFNELSKGTKQKFLIIMALLKESKIIILDEPFDGLDIITVEELIDTLKELKELGCSMIISSHKLDVLQKISDKVLILKDSDQVLYESIVNLKEKFKTDDLSEILRIVLRRE